MSWIQFLILLGFLSWGIADVASASPVHKDHAVEIHQAYTGLGSVLICVGIGLAIFRAF